MKYQNRTERCPHAFATNVPGIYCPECGESDRRAQRHRCASESPPTKVCRVCQVEKPVTEYYVNRGYVAPKCKRCVVDENREMRQRQCQATGESNNARR